MSEPTVESLQAEIAKAQRIIDLLRYELQMATENRIMVQAELLEAKSRIEELEKA